MVVVFRVLRVQQVALEWMPEDVVVAVDYDLLVLEATNSILVLKLVILVAHPILVVEQGSYGRLIPSLKFLYQFLLGESTYDSRYYDVWHRYLKNAAVPRKTALYCNLSGVARFETFFIKTKQ